MKPIIEATESGWPAYPQRYDASDERQRHACHDDGDEEHGAVAR
jgi:hypothetical protein